MFAVMLRGNFALVSPGFLYAWTTGSGQSLTCERFAEGFELYSVRETVDPELVCPCSPIAGLQRKKRFLEGVFEWRVGDSNP